ncbi:MAG: ABC transporter permease subunit [Anaerolineales bacterium]|nr:ABC transporter permease subunit [Anaerolineales bacterium]
MKTRRDIKRICFRMITLLMLGGLLLPFASQALWSVSQRWLFPALLPPEWSLRPWAYLLSPGANLWKTAATSLVIGIIVTLLSLIIGLPAGRALGLYHFKGKTLVKFLILAPAIVPSFAAAMGIHVVFIHLNLADTLFGVILVHLIPVLPYVVLVFCGVFANYNIEFEEEARTLGANIWQVLLYVTMPSIMPGVVVAGLFAFMISLSQYLLTLLIGGGRVLTLPILLLNFINSGDYAVSSAISLVFIIPAVIVLWVASPYLTNQHTSLGGFGRL